MIKILLTQKFRQITCLNFTLDGSLILPLILLDKGFFVNLYLTDIILEIMILVTLEAI